jgi:hypothetical protein
MDINLGPAHGQLLASQIQHQTLHFHHAGADMLSNMAAVCTRTSALLDSHQQQKLPGHGNTDHQQQGKQQQTRQCDQPQLRQLHKRAHLLQLVDGLLVMFSTLTQVVPGILLETTIELGEDGLPHAAAGLAVAALRVAQAVAAADEAACHPAAAHDAAAGAVLLAAASTAFLIGISMSSAAADAGTATPTQHPVAVHSQELHTFTASNDVRQLLVVNLATATYSKRLAAAATGISTGHAHQASSSSSSSQASSAPAHHEELLAGYGLQPRHAERAMRCFWRENWDVLAVASLWAAMAHAQRLEAEACCRNSSDSTSCASTHGSNSSRRPAHDAVPSPGSDQQQHKQQQAFICCCRCC